MGLPQLCTADNCMRSERKKQNISTTKSGTNNWFNWCGAWMRLINTIESVAKHVKQSVKKSDRLVKCYKLFSIHVRPISVRVEKKREEIQSNIRTFWKAFELQRENLLKNLTRPTHKWYTHNILWPMCLQYNLFLFLNALHDTLGCYAAGFFSSLEKKIFGFYVWNSLSTAI